MDGLFNAITLATPDNFMPSIDEMNKVINQRISELGRASTELEKKVAEDELYAAKLVADAYIFNRENMRMLS